MKKEQMSELCLLLSWACLIVVLIISLNDLRQSRKNEQYLSNQVNQLMKEKK